MPSTQGTSWNSPGSPPTRSGLAVATYSPSAAANATRPTGAPLLRARTRKRCQTQDHEPDQDEVGELSVSPDDQAGLPRDQQAGQRQRQHQRRPTDERPV